MKTLPDFAPDGLLPPGAWSCGPEEFLGRFGRGKVREPLANAFRDLIHFARQRGALRILVGGSFVSNRAKPSDLDCAVVFENENQIPDAVDRLQLNGVRLDIFYCSVDEPELLGAVLKLFGKNRREREVGVVDVTLSEGGGVPVDELAEDPSDRVFGVMMRTYGNRQIDIVGRIGDGLSSVVDRNPDRLLVTVHGIRGVGEWNAEIAHIASSRGWIVAPFVYGYQEATVLSNEQKSREIVDKLRQHLFAMEERYRCPVSVIAHSFGTYLVAKYCLGFDQPPVVLDTAIFTGAILNPKLDLERFRGRIGHILNEVAPNDGWVDFAPSARLKKDELIGNAGKVGFAGKSELLTQRSNEIFNHVNVIRPDVIAKMWMPWLEARAAAHRD